MIGASDERPGDNRIESDRLGLRRDLLELCGRKIPLDRGRPRGRPEVLSDRHDIDADVTEIDERFANLRARLPQPDHQPALHLPILDPVVQAGEDTERLHVAGPPIAKGRRQPSNRLDVVGEDVRASRRQTTERRLIPAD